MKMLIYGIIILVSLMIPVQRADVGKLRPIETIYIYKEGESVVIKTDTGDKGKGNNLSAALDNMKISALGIIYLDTAEYVIVEEGCEDILCELEEAVKNSAYVYVTNTEIDLTAIARYLEVHKPAMTMKMWNSERKVLDK